MTKWAYGVTTILERVMPDGSRSLSDRIETLLPRTLASLKSAGFDSPRLFVDGARDDSLYRQFGLEVVTRYPAIRTHGNWILSLYELYIRNPECDRYAIFQDDFVMYKNLKSYLEYCPYPPKSYFNLYTFPVNQALATGVKEPAWFLSNQLGKGAVALMFDRETVITLLSSRHMVARPQDPHRGWHAVDGGICTALHNEGWKEYCHTPSLVQHTGTKTTTQPDSYIQPLALSFKGEQFDASTMISTVNELYLTGDAWTVEKNALEEAIAGDEARLRRSTTPDERGKYERHIFRYRSELRNHLTKRPIS